MIALVDLTATDGAGNGWMLELSPVTAVAAGLRRLRHCEALDVAVVDVTEAAFQDAVQRRPPVPVYASGAVRPFSVRRSLAPRVKGVDAPGWNLSFIGVTGLSTLGEGIRVGHVDTGVDVRHPALTGRVARAVCILKNGTDVETVDIDPAQMTDYMGHGTKTASIICGGHALGVAPGARLYVAALEPPAWNDVQLCEAFDWLIRQQVQVAWLGMERPDEISPTHTMLIRKLLAKGVLPVTAIGNRMKGNSSTPGNVEESLSTGALKDGGDVWEGSGSCVSPVSKQTLPLYAAPGASIPVADWSLAGNNGSPTVGYYDGTSLAGPHIVGIIAALMQGCQSVTPMDAIKALTDSSELERIPADRARFGAPTLGRAMTKLKGC